MTYEVRLQGFSVSRLILTGFNGFTNGHANQLFAFLSVNAIGQIVTHRGTLDHITVQLPHPRGDPFPDLYWDSHMVTAGVPGGGFNVRAAADATGLNAVADFRFWDIAPFTVLPNFNTPDLRILPWGDGRAGTGPASAPPVQRSSNTGSYIIKTHRDFKNGIFAWLRNPDRLGQVTTTVSVGAFLPNELITGNLGGVAGSLAIPSNQRIIFQSNSIAVPFQIGEVITGFTSLATATVVTFEGQLIQQLICQVNGVFTVRQED